jgi:hypothetical protein
VSTPVAAAPVVSIEPAPVVSAVTGAFRVGESVVIVVVDVVSEADLFSASLLQATSVPAIANTATNFFIVVLILVNEWAQR